MRAFIVVLLLYTNIFALDILYEIKEPYVFKKDGKITGYALSPVLKALKASNIKYTLIEKPFNEQLKEIKQNKKAVCAVAWEKSESFNKFTKFTKAVFQDKPYGIVTQRRSDLDQNTNINDLIKNKTHKVLVKKGLPYPKELTNVLNQLPKKVVDTKKDYNMVTLVAKKKGDFAFIPYGDAIVLLQKHKYRSRIKLIMPQGIENGNKKYLACSLKVKNQNIKKLNKYLP